DSKRSVIVSDTGIGIPSEQLPRIFERFYRGESARRHAEGAGLGLAIAQWIADFHGARIAVTSQSGGTRVQIDFPAGAEASRSDLPLDLPWLRSPRIGAAEAARDAARYRFAFERAAIRFDVDTTYTRSLAAALHARLSRRTAADADSLLKVAELRRDVGDVSELDVRLAAVNAGQLENVALDDSLASLSVLLSLQLQMGL